MKKVLFITIWIFLIFTSGCNKEVKNIPPDEKVDSNVEKEVYIKIVTTNKLLYHMVKDIVKDKHTVDYMLKTEEDQWAFNYSNDSLKNISEKDMFIYMGGGYEPWIPNFIRDINKEKLGIINVSRGVRLLTLSESYKYGDTEFKENPYYWLNPDDYKIALANIKNSIEEKDPKNREYYDRNFNESLGNIDSCLEDIKILNEEAGKYTFVVIGDKLDYFIKYLNLKAIKINPDNYNGIDDESMNEKLKNVDNLIFLYDDNNILEQYNGFIEKNNMQTAHIIVYKFDMQYPEILNYNINSIKSVLKK